MSEIITLPNGIKLAYLNIPYIHSVSCGVYVKVGSGNESAVNNGIAHFTEHLLFKGTKKRTAFKIVEEMDSLGAEMNAFTSKEMTAFYFRSTDDVVEECMDVLSDILLNSTFPDEELEKERQVILEEISMTSDVPDDLVQDLTAMAFWGEGSSLGRTILGPEKNVKAFTSDDVRKFVSEHYVAENIVVSVCGNISRDRVIELVSKYFVFPSKPIKRAEIVLPSKFGGKVVSAIKDIEQANVSIAFPGYKYYADEYDALGLLSGAFGSGMSSVLFQEVREKLGLVYSIYTYPCAYEKNGAVCIYFGTNPKNVCKTLGTIKSCIDNLMQKGLPEENFLRTKKQMLSSYIFSSESCMSLMRSIAKSVLFGYKPFSIEDTIERVKALTLDDVNNLIPHIFDTNQIGVGYVGKKVDCDFIKILAE